MGQITWIGCFLNNNNNNNIIKIAEIRNNTTVIIQYKNKDHNKLKGKKNIQQILMKNINILKDIIFK